MSTYYGFNPPFVGGQAKYFSRQEDERLVKNDILQLLLTIPGERVMRPTFGVNLRNFVFENSTDLDLSNLRSEILESLAREEPRVTVLSLNMTPKNDQNYLVINLVFTLKIDPSNRINFDTLIKVGNA